MPTLSTIGYQSATMRSFIETLTNANIKLLVDVRAVAMSRRPGFAKTALSGNLDTAGIDYLHFRKLGTPPDGRAAARAGRHEEMQRIFREQLATAEAQAELGKLADLVRGSRKVAIMCFEAEAEHCHRRIVARAVAELLPIAIDDLMPDVGE